MPDTLSDRVARTLLEPYVLNPRTVNTYKDNTILVKDEVLQADNVIFDTGVTEKVLGTTLANSDSPGNNPVYGLHRCYGRDGTRVLLRLSGGH